MSRVGRRSNMIVLSSLALTLLGCSNDPSTTGVTNLGPDGKYQCTAPDCCVPVDIYASKILVYQSNGHIELDIILGVPSAAAEAWLAEVEATLSWGASVTCTGTFSESSHGFVGMTCPTLALDGAPACDAAATLTLRPITSTTRDPSSKQLDCAGRGRGQVKIPVSLTCPSCPSGISPYDQCHYPGATCDYSAMTSSSTWGRLPCSCQMSEDGDYRWSCAIP
jgi:hypothetical protein